VFLIGQAKWRLQVAASGEPNQACKRRITTMFVVHERAFQWNRVIRFLALMTAIAALTLGKASAQTLQDPYVSFEMVNGSQLFMASGTGYNEARINGNLMEVWEGANNQNVWMSINNNQAFTFSEALTNTTPTVVPWGTRGYMVLFTGTDNHIWYSFVGTDGSHSSQWFQVPHNQTTGMPVAAAPMGGEGTTNVYVAYRGGGNDQQIYQTWYDGQSGTWSESTLVGNLQSPSQPAVTYNIATNQIVVTAQGEDNQLWMNSQTLGASGWGGWWDTGVAYFGPPALVSIPSGYMVTEALSDSNNDFTLALFNSNGALINTLDDSQAGYYGYTSALGPFFANAETVNLTTIGDQVWGLYDAQISDSNSDSGFQSGGIYHRVL
jgi:hypothetical protein